MLKLKKWFAGLLLVTLGLFTLGSHSSAAATFTDIKPDYEHYDAIMYLVGREVISGYPEDNTFRPNKNVTRGQVAKMLARELQLDLTNVKDPGFKDIPKDHPYYAEIAALVDAGIITGFPEDNTYRSSANLTRGQMSKIITLAFELPESKWTGTPFTDVKEVHWFKTYVQTLFELEITKGSTATTYSPSSPVRRGQLTAFIYRAVEAKAEITPPPVTEPEPEEEVIEYSVDTIVNGQVVPGKKYTTLADAQKQYSGGNQVISANGKIIVMSSGMAVSQLFGGNPTILYDVNKRERTYVTFDVEMQYVSSDGEWVKVQYAGQEGYVKVDGVQLLPTAMITNRSYYANENGEIRHYIYRHATSKYESLVYGKAPSFMATGKKYYSWDGVTFYDAAGKFVGEAYNYYQFLPARSKTAYTAEEIDAIVLSELQRLEKTGQAKYKDASTKSKLLGIGAILKDVEAKSQVNALLILTVAFNESDYGMSNRAQSQNNLFGLYVYDADPLKKEFVSVEANVQELINAFWNKNYIPPNAVYANGAVLGHKGIGFNVKYASDPHWGQKAAGHYYRLDKLMGMKDAQQDIKIGFTTTAPLNVRTAPVVTPSTLEFTYRNSANLPVYIAKQENGWTEVVSDKLLTTTLYISSDYIRPVTTVK